MKNSKCSLNNCMLLMACISLQSVQGVLIVNENFDYGGSGEVSVVPGGWQDGTSNIVYAADVTAGWTGDSDYTLSGAGGSLYAKSQSSYRGAQRDIGTALTGTFWTSLMIRSDTADSAIASAAVAFENGDYSFSNFDGFAFGINGDGNLTTAANSTTDSEMNVESPTVGLPSGFGLYIAKITVNGGGANDAIDLWAFDSGDSFGQTEASLGSALFSSTTIQYGDSIQDIWLGGRFESNNDTGNVNNNAYFDNLRISNLSGDNGLSEVLTGVAVPEPSSFLLVSIGLMFIAGYGCRRKK